MIDLGQYLRILFRWSWLIGLLTVLGLLAGLLFRLTQPVTYASTATLLVRPSPPNVTINSESLQGIDPSISQLTQFDFPVRTLAELGNKPEVESKVQAELTEKLPQNLREPGALLGQVTVSEVRGRPFLLQVVAVNKTPGLSTEIANSWANMMVEYLNPLVGTSYLNPARASEQLTTAQRQWNDAEVALNRFEATSNLPSISSQNAATVSLLNDYRQQLNQIELNLNSAAQLRTQLAASQGSEASSLPVLLLSLSAFTAQASSVDVGDFLPPITSGGRGSSTQLDPDNMSAPRPRQSSSVIVQPTLQELSSLTPQEQVRFVDSLTGVLRQAQATAQGRAQALEKTIPGLREQLQRTGADRDRLVIIRDGNRSAYQQLRTLVDEQQVERGIQNEKITVTGRALTPVRSSLSGPLPLAAGAVTGALLGTLLAFLMEFRRRSRRPHPSPRSNSKVEKLDTVEESDIVIGGR